MGLFSRKDKGNINKELPNDKGKNPKFKDVTERELTEEDLEHIGANMDLRQWEGMLRKKEELESKEPGFKR